MKKKLMEKIIVVLEMLAIWQLGSILLSKECLPLPLDAFKAMVNMIIDGSIGIHIWDSTKRIVLGLACSLPLGMLLGYFPKLDKYIGTFFNFLYIIPKVVFLPIIIVLFGIGDIPKIFLIAIVLFFQQTIVIRDSVKNIPKEYYRAIEVWGASKYNIFWHLIIPACLPEVMTSLRMSLGTSIALLFITENFASFTGLGYYITACMDRRNYDRMYGTIILLALLGSLLYVLIGMAEHKLCYWKVIEKER